MEYPPTRDEQDQCATEAETIDAQRPEAEQVGNVRQQECTDTGQEGASCGRYEEAEVTQDREGQAS